MHGKNEMDTISIHPPLAGRDYCFKIPPSDSGISIHPPLAGRDNQQPASVSPPEISIHPPLAGRDQLQEVCVIALVYFNPPAPCGAGPG